MPTPLGYSRVYDVTLTADPKINALLAGTSWSNGTGVTQLSYSFYEPGVSEYARWYSDDNEYTWAYALTDNQKNAITGGLDAWSAVANVNFNLVRDSSSEVGDLRFGGYAGMGDQAAAWAYFPDRSPTAGDVWIGPASYELNPTAGSYDYMTFMHEIGHALGLKHPFSGVPGNKTVLSAAFDDVRYTLMSYDNGYSFQPTTPMLLDILAMQKLYGTNFNWQSGNTTYKWDAGASVFETLWDGGGTDTIDASNQAAAVTLNLNEGQFSNIGKSFQDFTTGKAINNGLAIAYGAKIENAIGSAFADTLIGNNLDNVLDGRGGKDRMTGGLGNDTYIVDDVGDIVVETSRLATEIDTVQASVNWTLGANLENLTLTGNANLSGTGNALANVIRGNAGNNQLNGGVGNDWLVGGAGNDLLDGGVGLDILSGGTGDDIYIVDNLGDTVVENVGEGRDLVRTSISYTLATNVENGELLGAKALSLTGNSLDNVLTGNNAANVLRGGGGADTLIGGLGNDSYYVDSTDDVIVESSAAPKEIDNVFSSVNWTLGANLEYLTLIGDGAINGTGNSLNNRITGNAGNNVLNGGEGIDTLIGGLGNDTYVVDNLRDVIVETSRKVDEIDTVRSSVNWTLGANLENLTLTGSAALTGNGNALNNVLTGNAGDNLLDGKAGLDTLIGGLGNDTYVLDQAGELGLVRELANQGDDTLRIIYKAAATTTTVDLNAANLANVENVTLVGAGAFTVLGNSLDNTLTGNAFANTLNGGAGNDVLNGGAGADRMLGGTGNDIYYVDSVADQVVELAGQGRDLVRSAISYTLAANVEDGELLGAKALTLTGNELDNVLTGNNAANVLRGGGGADTLIGGLGNDSYYVDSTDDVIVESSAALKEIDNVFSSVNWTLGANLEYLTLTGDAAINGTGNSLNNRITGNAGNNVLNGGEGIDTLIGGLGNDTYVVDNLRDVIVETSRKVDEIDTVRSSVNWTLGANLENLTLTGNAALTGTGNALNNVLIGNAGNNVLNGGAGNDQLNGGAGNDTLIGGLGTDTLTGGAGADRFVFNLLKDMGLGDKRDVITDFSRVQGDKIDFSKLDANILSKGLNAFTFIDNGAFTGAGQLRFDKEILSGNINGNLNADFEIHLVGVTTFSASDLA